MGVNEPVRKLHWPGLRAAVAALSLALLSACGPAPAPATLQDPFEADNRRIHAFNVALDRALVRPASDVYGEVTPGPVRQGVSNFANNLDVPGDVLNSLLQGRAEPAVQNTFRFLINSTVGIAGLIDVATPMGLPGRETDFGETLFVWGVPEGNYLELPALGPSIERDAYGRVVDLIINPVRVVLPKPQSTYATLTKVGSGLGNRFRYSDTIDSILYESADSYVQTRLLFLQNRRFELGQETGSDAFEDPYADANFEDPYAQ